MAQGDELLIVDANPGHQQGMRKLFEDAGYVCTATGNIAEARELLEQKFFPAALVDLDVERAGAGLDLLRAARERSPATAVVVLTGRRSCEAAIAAFRLGAADVVFKQPDQVEHLKNAVGAACDRNRATKGDDAIFEQIQHVLDESFRVMLALARKVYRDVSTGSGQAKPRVLVVEGDQDFLQRLARLLADKDWEIAAEMAGGAALDKASEHVFDVVAARDELMDLPGGMVVKTMQASRAEMVGLVYSKPGSEGRIERYVEGRAEDVDRPFEGPEHLVRKLEEVVERLGATQRDRRTIQAFRSDHEDFFRRFAELKLRIDRMVG